MKCRVMKTGRVIAAVLMITLLLAVDVFAAISKITVVDEMSGTGSVRYTESIIDTEEDASLTIYKYEYNGDETVDSDGNYTAGLPDGAVALDGVTYTYYKIAAIVMSNDGDQITGMKYDVTSEAAAYLKLVEPGLYTGKELTDALDKVNTNQSDKAALEAWINASGTAMAPTNGGRTFASGMELGLYLVAETDVPAKVTMRANPFLVSLPMTNASDVVSGEGADRKTYPAESLWQYDVIVQPKNTTEQPDLDKNIVEGESLSKVDTVGIGDTVTYQIRADIPKNIANMSKYEISDTMTSGLTFSGFEKMKITVDGQNVSAAEQIVPGTDGATFTVKFISTDGSTNTLSAYPGKEVIITYEAVLNENAILTSDGNPNTAKLVYNHNAGLDSSDKDVTVEDVPQPKVYTYGIEWTKLDEQGNPLKDVEFEIYRGEETSPLTVREAAPTDVRTSTAERAYYADASASETTLTTGSDGKIYVYGLAPGTYYLKETKTVKGYTLLPDRIKVVLTEERTATEDAVNGTYLKPEPGVEYYRLRPDGTYALFTNLSKADSKGFVNFGTPDVYVKSDSGFVKPVLYSMTVGLNHKDAEPYTVSDYEMKVSFTVQNNASFDLPRTGGAGVPIFIGGGIVIALAAAGLIIVNKKKRAVR